MKFMLLTAHSPEYKELAALTLPTKAHYATQWGHQLSIGVHTGWKRVAWERVELWLKTMREGAFDWLFFTGCDAAITNDQIDLESLVKPGVDFIFCCDGCGLQSDSWLMRNCPESIEFLEEVLSFDGEVPNEQDAMQLVLSGEPILENFLFGLAKGRKSGGAECDEALRAWYQGILNHSRLICQILPQRKLNAYPHEAYGMKTPTNSGWQPGDFVLHVPGLPLPERMAVFRKVLELELPF